MAVSELRTIRKTRSGLTALQGVVQWRDFGELRVIRTGLRSKPTRGHPNGAPAAECRCSCGRKTIVPNYKLLSGNTRTCGHGKCTHPRGRNPDRDAILAWLGEHGPSRLTEISGGLGWSDGKAGGQLYLMLDAGEIERPRRGVYCLPGQD